MGLFAADFIVICNGVTVKKVSPAAEQMFNRFADSNDKERMGFYSNFYYLNAMSTSGRYVDFWYCLINGWLCVYRRLRQNRVFSIESAILNINGDYTDEKAYMRRFVGILRVLNKGRDVVLMANKMTNFSMFRGCHLSRENSDFIFRCDDLIQLEGRKYKSLRHTVNRFKAEHNFLFRDYVPSDYSAVMELYDSWVKGLRERYRGATILNAGLLEGVLANHPMDRCRLFVCIVDGSLHGFIAVSRLCRDTCSVICEYTDIHLSGLAEMMWYESLKYFPDCTYENDGSGGKDDKDGLYRYKLKHNPVMMLESCAVQFNQRGSRPPKSFMS